MGIINDIYSGMVTRLGVSASSYTQLSYQQNIEKNKFKGNYKGYAITPLEATEDDSVTGAFIVDHLYQITFTDGYSEGGRSQVGDELQYTRVMELNTLILEVFDDLARQKSALGSNILVVNDLRISSPEYLDEEKTVLVSCTMNIKYKINR